MCCRAIKSKLIGVTSITYQCQHSNFAKVGSMFCQMPDKLSEKYPRCFNFCRSGEISPNLVTLTPTHTHFFTQYTQVQAHILYQVMHLYDDPHIGSLFHTTYNFSENFFPFYRMQKLALLVTNPSHTLPRYNHLFKRSLRV